jgi:hypothetical protein
VLLSTHLAHWPVGAESPPSNASSALPIAAPGQLPLGSTAPGQSRAPLERSQQVRTEPWRSLSRLSVRAWQTGTAGVHVSHDMAGAAGSRWEHDGTWRWWQSLAFVGGILSITVGASILSGVELVEFVVLAALHSCSGACAAFGRCCCAPSRAERYAAAVRARSTKAVSLDSELRGGAATGISSPTHRTVMAGRRDPNSQAGLRPEASSLQVTGPQSAAPPRVQTSGPELRHDPGTPSQTGVKTPLATPMQPFDWGSLPSGVLQLETVTPSGSARDLATSNYRF